MYVVMKEITNAYFRKNDLNRRNSSSNIFFIFNPIMISSNVNHVRYNAI